MPAKGPWHAFHASGAGETPVGAPGRALRNPVSNSPANYYRRKLITWKIMSFEKFLGFGLDTFLTWWPDQNVD